ncbi:MAG: hypothetical protein IBX45_11680 [Campylobacterales bacterium]|nr:hypothetical protein [Campylobacterales bacterium]
MKTVALVFLLLLGCALGFALWELQEALHVRPTYVQEALHVSGVSHPVTAVLLNFRAFDTLLEVTVLLVAFLAFLGLAPTAKHAIFFRPGGMPKFLVRTLSPFFLVGVTYLWLIGGVDSGGAFQAAALLATLIIFYRLSGYKFGYKISPFYVRVGAVFGLAFFLFMGALSLVWGEFFTYKNALAGGVILTIEFFLTFTLGILLAGFFVGNEPSRSKRW